MNTLKWYIAAILNDVQAWRWRHTRRDGILAALSGATLDAWWPEGDAVGHYPHAHETPCEDTLPWTLHGVFTDERVIAPNNDLMPHDLEGDRCACGPDVEYLEDGCKLITHHSLDGRELSEPDHTP